MILHMHKSIQNLKTEAINLGFKKYYNLRKFPFRGRRGFLIIQH